MLNAHISFDHSYGTDAHHTVDVIVPQGIDNPHIIMCLHAGWWTQGRQSDLRACMYALAARGYAVASIGHRLLNDHLNGHDIMDDVMAGIACATEEAVLMGAESRVACLLGSGAGGLLAVNAALRQPDAFAGIITCGATPSLTVWDGCPPHIATALASFAGAADVDADADVNADQKTLSLDPLKADLSLLPPIHIMHGDSDPEVPASQARELHVACINAGRESTFSVLTGTAHHFIEDPDNRYTQSAYARIDTWLHALYNPADAVLCGEAPFMV